MKHPIKSKKVLPSSIGHEKKRARDINGKKKERTIFINPNEPKSDKMLAKKDKKEMVDESEEIADTATNTKHPKKFHMTIDQIQRRIRDLEKRISELEGPENAKIRKRTFQTLGKLKAALTNPVDLTVDPQIEIDRLRMKKERQVQKKLDKKRKEEEERLEEKRKAKNKVCLVCKKKGHIAENCFEKPETASFKLICFNCGSAEHSLNNCPVERIPGKLPFATCFFCKEKGHIGRDCLQNENGIYFKGGSCFICGSTRHLAKECDKRYQDTENRFVNTDASKTDNEDPESALLSKKKIKKETEKANKAGRKGVIGDEEEDVGELLDDDEYEEDNDEVEYGDDDGDEEYE